MPEIGDDLAEALETETVTLFVLRTSKRGGRLDYQREVRDARENVAFKLLAKGWPKDEVADILHITVRAMDDILKRNRNGGTAA